MHIASKYFEFNSEIVVILTFFEGNFELSWQWRSHIFKEIGQTNIKISGEWNKYRRGQHLQSGANKQSETEIQNTRCQPQVLQSSGWGGEFSEKLEDNREL